MNGNRVIQRLKDLECSALLRKYGFYRKINSKRYLCRMCSPVLLLMFGSIFCNCNHFNQNSSIYADLSFKIKGDSTYIPIIGYVIDNIIPQYYMKDYSCIGDEPFFNKPLDNLSKISINNQTLVIAEFGIIKQRYYFLLNQKRQITDHIESTSYRESIAKREIYDWNRDGSHDIIEQRNYSGQLFWSTTEIVYSIINNKFERIFSLEIEEVNCVTLDEYGRGSALQRTYKQKQPDLFRITEISGYVNGSTDSSDNIILSPNADCRYSEMTTQELLDKFGTQYEKSCDNDGIVL